MDDHAQQHQVSRKLQLEPLRHGWPTSRVRKEEAQQLPRGVRSARVGVGTGWTASRPGVSGASTLVAMEDTLVCAGFRVTVMHNGREALETDARDRADLLLTDLRMPIMDGKVLIQRLRGRRSGLPIVIVTGTPPEGGVDSIQSGDPGRTRLLVKRTLMADLVTAVQWVIKQPWRHRACRSHFISSGSVVRDASLTAVLSPET